MARQWRKTTDDQGPTAILDDIEDEDEQSDSDFIEERDNRSAYRAKATSQDSAGHAMRSGLYKALVRDHGNSMRECQACTAPA